MKIKEAKFNYYILDKQIIQLLNEFIKISTLMFDLKFAYSIDIDQISKFKTQFEKYKKFNFVKDILTQLTNILDKHQDVKSDSSKNKINSLFKSIESKSRVLENGIKKGNFDKMKSVKVSSEFEQLQKLIQSEADIIKSGLSIDVLKNGLISIFNAGKKMGLLDSFDKNDWKQLNSIKFDMNKTYFNYLPELSFKNDFETFVYFIQKIKSDKAKQIKLDTIEFQDYLEILYRNNSEFKQFKKIVDNYLHSNDKKLIPKILDFLEKFPIIKEENEERKKKIKTVYRGIHISRDDPLYYGFRNRKNVDFEFAATSLTQSTAKDFAVGLGGILMKPNKEGEREGLMLTYSTTPSSIIIDFNILGSVFGEGEVYINTKKSKLINVEEVIY